VIVKTGRFGQLAVGDNERITIPQGILGFPDYKNFCLVDPADDTFILWLQCLDNTQLVFPVLEPKIFFPEYVVRLSAAELRDLNLASINDSAVFTILTIPAELSQMTANIKAPLVLNLKEQIGKQVVLQENEYNIKHPMFKELRTHLVTMSSQKINQTSDKQVETQSIASPIVVGDIRPSTTVRSLKA
jgi:flagellar assembly factor FliW